MAIMTGCVGALSAFYHDSTDISDPHATHDRVDPHDREDADDRRDGLQVFDRPAVHLSEERARLRDQLPAHVLRGAVRGVQGRTRCWRAPWTASSSCTPTTSRTPRPRRCGSPARRAPIRSPASRPAAPALWGPAHGGANEAALKMLAEIGRVERIPEYIKRAKDKNDSFRLMGFGHRVYKNYDPRAKIMQKTCHEVLNELGHQGRSAARRRAGARAHRAVGRLLHREEALSEHRLLFGHHAQGDGLPDHHVHGAVRGRAHRRLDRAVEGNDRGSATRRSAARASSIPAPTRRDYSADLAPEVGGRIVVASGAPERCRRPGRSATAAPIFHDGHRAGRTPRPAAGVPGCRSSSGAKRVGQRLLACNPAARTPARRSRRGPGWPG